MEPRSSIFNFSTLRGPFRIGLAAPIAVGLLVVTRVALSPMRDVPDYDNADFNRFVAVEKYEFRDREAPPLVIVSGSSRTQYGIEAKALGTALGIDGERVANLSLPSGNPWTTLTMLERNDLEGVRAILVDLAPIQFNASHVPTRNRFGHLAAPGERLAIDGHPDKASLAIDYATGHIGIRRSLRSYGLALSNARRGTIWGSDDRERLPPAWVKQADHAKLRDEMFAENLNWRPENFDAETFGDWNFSEFLFDQLEALKSLAAENGIPLVLHQPPFHPTYLVALNERGAYRDYRKRMEGLADANTHVWLYEDPAEIGIEVDQILDYGHFGREAATRYSRVLGARVAPLLKR